MNEREYFDKYVTYFPIIGKQLKKERTVIKVIDKNTGGVEVYNNWEELNDVYKLFPTNKKNVTVIAEAPLVKYWTYGHKTRSKELIDFFSHQYESYKIPSKSFAHSFNKPDWVYYIDSRHSICGTNNTLVIDLLKNSNDWKEYKLPDPKKFTKAQIADMIGMDINGFEII